MNAGKERWHTFCNEKRK
ncbi:Protein of unknown function [Bacillus wiedmannii]|nr:Protein of unknown function [Bacillus wiedmannii]